MTFSHELILNRLRHQESIAHEASFTPSVREKIIRYGAPVGCLMEHHARLGRCMFRIRDIFHAYELSAAIPPSGTVIIADELENGCGRFERPWHAPRGGIWLALALADTMLPEVSRLLPFVAGIACCETIRELGLGVSLKWVNDLCFRGRKIAGVLCESMRSPIYGDNYFVIGIGININNREFPPELRSIAGSVRDFMGREFDLSEIIYSLLAKLAWNIGLLHYQEECLLGEKDQRCQELVIKRWLELSDTVGRRVRYGFDVQRHPLYRAVVKRVTGDGGLVMVLEDGAEITEHGGEIVYLDPSQ
ncbi:MAG: biotin--[acetyl-CoA-carboxylase] ligase [Desulfobulbaceae bacterium]|nr:biotin--[acetyl-CoA-carboxylase] ligase [Desulfobulbaceae bacterium]